jgi:hypothetical protein
MSLPPSTASATLSTSGYQDGLGRRVLAFDREYGVMLERLLLRPELSAFGHALGAQLSHLASIEDERFARMRAVERDPETGALTVLSEFVEGQRLSELLDIAATEVRDENAAPGLDVALGFLLELLPAIAAFHAKTGLAHGAISAGRVIVTLEGQVVLLDGLFGKALERLRFTPQRLWTELGIAVPAASYPARLDVASDIAQAAMGAVALIVGRPLSATDHPEGLPALVSEAVEIAQIRGSAIFASALQRFLQRALPLPDRQPFATADQAATELRRVLQVQIGADRARGALADFVAEMGRIAGRTPQVRVAPARPSAAKPAAAPPKPAKPPAPAAAPRPSTPPIAAAPPNPAAKPISIAPPEPAIAIKATETPRPGPAPSAPAPIEPAVPPAPVAISTPEPVRVDPPPAFAERVTPPPSPDPIVEAPPARDPIAASAPASEWASDPEPAPKPEPPRSDFAVEEEPIADIVATFVPASGSKSHSRRKKQRGPRAKRDKLRSIAAPPSTLAAKPVKEPPAPAPAPPPPPPAPAPAPLLKPRAVETVWEAPDAPAPAPLAPPLPLPVQPPMPIQPMPIQAAPAPPIPMPFQAPVPPQPIPMPFQARPVVPFQSTPESLWQPPTTAVPLAPVAAVPVTPSQALVQASPAPLRLKTEPAPVRKVERHVQAAVPMERYPFERATAEEPSKFPWKLAAAVLIITVVGVGIGRAYLPRTTKPAQTDYTAPDPSAPAGAGASSLTGSSGSILIETQPAGAKILLDGRPAGESPTTLEGVAPGRHVVTLTTPSGTVKRVVRVEHGKTATIDVAVFSGWAAVYAPIVLDVMENGRSLGTTEQGKIMLPPGIHTLVLSNGQLGYKTTTSVEIEAGEERAITVDPRGVMNLNAVPWAEVWVDGQKKGETPIANLSVPLGTRDVVFKHPEFGERRMTATVTAKAPTVLSVDFSKPSQP